MKLFPELTQVQSIAETLSRSTIAAAHVEIIAQIPVPKIFAREHRELPIYSFSFGSRDPEAPVFGIVGGVHGLERIGSQVALSFLHSITERLSWDESFQHDLKKIRLSFIPVANPVGMYLERRSNGNGVDIMRNAAIDAETKASFMVGGHRISNRLPWYRGKLGAPMEEEGRVLCDFVRKESFKSKLAIWLDVHSGYGVKDRLWFPFAKSVRPFPHLGETYGLKKLFDRTYPYHVYQIEPQALEYTTHGDLWDFLYEEFSAKQIVNGSLFLPMTLEMGSWMWIRKNPFQAFSFLGPFNPIKPHRKKRTLRRHLILFDFLMRAAGNGNAWATLPASIRSELLEEALKHWYNQ